jgi:tetratricopeptide (TPR) repeat protein
MVTSALELYAAERPDDGQTPDALLRLGRAYQASGLFDKAITAFQRNQLRYPQSLAASKSGVPLAQALMAKGPENNGRAEKVLLGVVENNPNIGPDAEEFGQALFELSQLYYRTSRYEEAIARLGEMIQRYPQDARMTQLVFLTADSYRKSAAALAEKQKEQKGNTAEIEAERNKRLQSAKQEYDRVVDMFHDTTPTAELDKLYLKLAYFYRADCAYDLHDYGKAIGLYDQALTHYQDQAASLSALVQIVNAHCELGNYEEAKRANQRAMTLLMKMPATAFADGAFPMPKEYWEQWLKWTNNAGIWTGLEDAKQAARKFANTGNETNQ